MELDANVSWVAGVVLWSSNSSCTLGSEFDLPLLPFVGWDTKPWPCLHMLNAVSGTLMEPHSLK